MKTTAPVSRSGRFTSGPAAEVAAFSQSISFDRRLWRQDIRGSLVHARMLRNGGFLTASELGSIQKALKSIAADIESGLLAWKPELEDVHMNIESELTRRAPAGAKLHTARSRNDQVALDMRLWVRDEIDALQEDLRRLQQSIVDWCARQPEVILPGYTHLQRGQPVYAAHHLLAYVEMLERDRGRFRDARFRANECPLGSGALAGTTLPIDRAFVARELGFVDDRGNARLTANSMDAVSDRDFVVEFCAAAALLAVHLSRLAEDLILWASSEFHFIRINDAYTTGSSLMPQKKNPDVAELARGKSGRVIGNLVSLLTVLKGLPMTYNRDLQEDKESLFDSADTVRSTTSLMAGMLRNTCFIPESCRRAASDPQLLATDLADALVRKNVPFRQAHHLVGDLVALAEKKGVPLNRLALDQLQSVSPHFDAATLDLFDLDRSMTRKELPGAPGPREVRQRVARWQRKLSGPPQ